MKLCDWCGMRPGTHSFMGEWICDECDEAQLGDSIFEGGEE